MDQVTPTLWDLLSAMETSPTALFTNGHMKTWAGLGFSAHQFTGTQMFCGAHRLHIVPQIFILCGHVHIGPDWQIDTPGRLQGFSHSPPRLPTWSWPGVGWEPGCQGGRRSGFPSIPFLRLSAQK